MSANPFGSRGPFHSCRRQSAAGTWRPIEATAAASIHQLRLIEREGLRHAGPVGRIGACAIVDMALLDMRFCVAHRPRRILEQHLFLLWGHLPEQISGLLPMVVV